MSYEDDIDLCGVYELNHEQLKLLGINVFNSDNKYSFFYDSSVSYY